MGFKINQNHQLANWLDTKQAAMKNVILSSNSQWKRAIGLPVAVANLAFRVAKIVGDVLENTLKGVLNIIAFPFVKDAHFMSGVKLLTLSQIRVAFRAVGLVGSAIDFVVLPIAYAIRGPKAGQDIFTMEGLFNKLDTSLTSRLPSNSAQPSTPRYEVYQE